MIQGTRRTMITAQPQTPLEPRSIPRPRALPGVARLGRRLVRDRMC